MKQYNSIQRYANFFTALKFGDQVEIIWKRAGFTFVKEGIVEKLFKKEALIKFTKKEGNK